MVSSYNCGRKRTGEVKVPEGSTIALWLLVPDNDAWEFKEGFLMDGHPSSECLSRSSMLKDRTGNSPSTAWLCSGDKGCTEG